MKRIFLISFFILLTGASFGQYANSWINYSQKYHYFKITKEGLYRIDSAALANSGIPLSTIDARSFQVFGRGKELPIYVKGESDGVLNANDYIEFFAEPNDGFLDTSIYDLPGSQSNPYYSLFNDTALYYITWNSDTNNLRATLETATNFSSYTPSTYFFKELYYKPGQNGYAPVYYYGEIFSGGITFNQYTSTSGWFDAEILGGVTRGANFNTPQTYTAGPAATVTSIVTTQSNAATDSITKPNHHLRVTWNSNIAFDATTKGYTQQKINFSIPGSSLTGTTSVMVSSVNDLVPAPAVQRLAIGHITLKYPHTYNLENQSAFKLIAPDDAQGYTYFKATAFSGSNPILYDITNGARITLVNDGTFLNGLIPNTGVEKTCYIADESVITSITSLTPVTSSASFTNFNIVQGDYIIISHTSIINQANSYAAYRSLKGHDAMVADVEELYHQFAFGVVKHPLAIRNFIDFSLTSWTTTPQHLFLIGKSVHNNLSRNTSLFSKNLVPSLGSRSSDALLTAGLAGTKWEPAVPTGRLAAKNSTDVINYQSKMTEYENAASQPQEWMKKVLHFGGGSNDDQQTIFRSFLKTYEDIIEDTLFGGDVNTFLKNSTATIETSLTDSIRTRVNNGVSIMTFFGHAAGSSFDVNVDLPSTYNNKGKYPLMVANSCLVGDIHQPNINGNLTTSEDFVLIPDKGAIGFIASVGPGFQGYLHQYSTELYQNFGVDMYGKSIGKVIQSTVKEIQGNISDRVFISMLLDMTLHADPAMILYSHAKPDLMVNAQNVFISPSEVTTSNDSLTINVIVTNLGRATAAPYLVEVVRTFANGATDTLVQSVPGAYFKDTLKLTFAVNASIGDGLNKFRIIADALSQIDELSEFNNKVNFEYFIKSENLIPVYPYEYSVVPNQGVTLKASTANPFAAAANYRFEISLSDEFTSIVESNIINSVGGVVTWKPLALQNMPDSTVYFWRVSKDSVAGTSFRWKESSFQYINGKRGWGQAHFHQFKNDEFNFIKYNRPASTFDFNTAAKDLVVHNYGNPVDNANQTQSLKILYKIDLDIGDYGGCDNLPALHVAVIDPLTLQPWRTKYTDGSGNVQNPTHNFGNVNNEGACRQRTEGYFIFRTGDAAQMSALNNMLTTKIPAGHYVLIYSYYNSMSSQWGNTLHTTLEGMGANSLRTLNDSIPFIFFTKQGDVSTAQEVVGSAYNSIIELSVPLFNSITYGEITSTIIGPSLQWGSLHATAVSLESPSADSVNIHVIGIKKNGEENLLASYPGNNVKELNLNSIVDANLYPYLKLKAYKEDDSLQTAPQLKSWHVLYSPAPEAALNPSIAYSFASPLVQQGENISFTMAVQNISEFNMDSLNVSYWTEDENRIRKQVFYGKKSPLPADSTLITSIEFSSNGYSGKNNLWLEVNPRDVNWQKEQFHFNNIAYRSFEVVRDNINPLLDVTFDGVHILNRDIVSPKPLIVIQLNDENNFLMMSSVNDTTSFKIFLTDPAGNEKPLYFKDDNGNEQMKFYPASGTKNTAKIEYKGNFTRDGIYKLRVKASDKAGNRSGDKDYEIEFEVINRSSITEVLNYPNPFSTSTRFVFTLTGAEIPTEFKIQILTVTGKVVREILQDELGPIRIGRNVSAYAWNGTDEFGDRLANGVYLYRVITKINNQDIEHRTTSADKFFHKDFGKMYLLR